MACLCPNRKGNLVKVKITQYIFPLFIAGLLLHAPLHAADLMAVYREALEQDAQYSAARAALPGGPGKTATGPGRDCFPRSLFRREGGGN